MEDKISTVPIIHLSSFGFKYGPPPPDSQGHNGGFVFDCRGLPNPYWDETLRQYSGLDAPILAFMEARPEVQAFAGHASELIMQTATIYRKQGRESLYVAIGCTGGRHRSVYQTALMEARLSAGGFRVQVLHRDLHRGDQNSAHPGGLGGETRKGAPEHS